ncbi:MAG: cytochrome c [Nitrospirales bacterium]
MRHLQPFILSTLVLLSLALGPLISAHGEQKRSQTGDTLFQEYWRDCHGPQGYGRGALSPFLDQEPANLFSQFTQSKTDQELFSIIKNGGVVDMHGWADTFTDQEIRHLVSFIRGIS